MSTPEKLVTLRVRGVTSEVMMQTGLAEVTPGGRATTSPLVTFFVLLGAFSGVFTAVIVAMAGPNPILALMWSVGVAAMIALKLYGRPLSELGWSWGPARYHLIAFALPFVYAALAYGGAAIAGLVTILEPTKVNALVQASGFAFLPPPLGFVGAMALIVTTGMIQSMSSSLGEEIGWRGFLTPHLSRICGFVIGSLVTGAVWAAWHLPLIVLGGYNAGGDMRFELLSFGVGVLALSGPLAWLRLNADSLWPCVTLHASHNLFVQGIFDRLATRGAGEITIVGEFGILFASTLLLVSLPFWIMGARSYEARMRAA